MSRFPTSRRPRSGASAAEFALILPVFLLLLITVMDFGWLFFQRATLDMAATVGCRAGSLQDPGDGDANLALVQDVAAEAMKIELIRAGAGDCGDGCYTDVYAYGDPPGRSIVCIVGRDIEPLVGLAVEPMTLESSIAMRLEWQRWPE